MVTVIIPALNEAETVGSVIGLIKGSPLTSEIIVIDDKSSDNTLQVARDAGATVYTSTLLGKGASLREGILFARNEILLFLFSPRCLKYSMSVNYHFLRPCE